MIESGTGYNLQSFDGGKNWYAVESNDKGVIILGEANKSIPVSASIWMILTPLPNTSPSMDR